MRDKHRWIIGLIVLPALAAAGGCTHHVAVEPIKIEPIYITLDVNLKVDRELDRFFDFQDEAPAAPSDALETPAPGDAS